MPDQKFTGSDIQISLSITIRVQGHNLRSPGHCATAPCFQRNGKISRKVPEGSTVSYPCNFSPHGRKNYVGYFLLAGWWAVYQAILSEE